MISRICEAFQCPPDVAMRQDLDLCQLIMQERGFVFIYDEMKRDPKTLTKEREKFLEDMEKLSNQ